MKDLMKKDGYCDLHVHTNISDAMSFWTPEEVILRARDKGITHLALSDHNIGNCVWKEQSQQFGIDVISSVEFSSRFQLDAKSFEIHVVGFRMDPANFSIRRLVRDHRQEENRRAYLQAMLDGLKQEGIQLTLEEIKQKNPDSIHLGRVAIGEVLIERGYAGSMREVYDRYLGKGSGSPAYHSSKPYLTYRDLETVVTAVIRSGGLPILAHVPYYGMTEAEQGELLRKFKEYAGDLGAMETAYGDYPDDVVEQQRWLAKTYGLLESAGSDFHGYSGLDLKQGDPAIYRKLQERWERAFG